MSEWRSGQPTPSRRPLVVVLVVLVVLVAVGAFLLRDRLTGSPIDLAVGDCFDQPVGVVEIQEVQHQPCSEAHEAEVVFVGDMPDSDTVPSDDAYDTFVRANCVSAFNSYTGRDFETDSELTMTYYNPTPEGWSQDDHEIVCFLTRVDGTTMTASVKVAP